eukprot:4588258-Lingulodinium_polyedra.AAC.1
MAQSSRKVHDAVDMYGHGSATQYLCAGSRGGRVARQFRKSKRLTQRNHATGQREGQTVQESIERLSCFSREA